MSNTYTYHIPKSMPQGAYWYHSHLHTLTTPHVYYGLAGLLAIGRTDGNIPLVTEKQIPIRNMVLQYNYVFDRAGGLAQINNPNLAAMGQHASSRRKAMSWRRAPIVRCSRRSTSTQAKKGDEVLHHLVFGNCRWNVGPGRSATMRGRFEFIPSNLQRFTA